VIHARALMRHGLAYMDAAVPVTADAASALEEDAFRAFYDRTARQLWAYLYRASRDSAQADDLLQEAYFRLLRARVPFENDDHRVHYLFRIAANLVADTHRRRAPDHVPLTDHDQRPERAGTAAGAIEQRADVARALATLAPRDRDRLWLAYADGASHAEIASHLGVARPSIKAMLARARGRLAARLRGAGSAVHGRGRRR
jgi:RNA polymerase sigma-70 factor, ECF subfamily